MRFRRIALSVTAASLLGVCGSDAHAQVFANVRPMQAEASGQACDLGVCPPNLLTYGYYREIWRRWPGEDETASPDLTPFVRPDRTLPKTQVPDARDEAAQVHRRRTQISAQESDTDSSSSPSSPSTTPRPSTDPADTGDLFPEDLPGSLPTDGLQDDPLLPPDGEPIFPELDPQQPGADPLQDNLNTPDENEDDEFDLDVLDLGQRSRVDTHVSDRQNPLRRRSAKPHYANRRARTPTASPVQSSRSSAVVPASFQEPLKPRANPLRKN